MACRFARSVPPVLPSNPSACARSHESCLSRDPVYRRICTRGRQYPPSPAPSLARPELNGRKRTERNGTAKKWGKRKEKRNRTEWDGTDNKMERDGNGAFFYAYCISCDYDFTNLRVGCISNAVCMCMFACTVFPRISAAVFIYFKRRRGAVIICRWRL